MTQTKTFTDLALAEAWLRWNGFTNYLGFWTYQTVDGSATATVCGVDTPVIEVVFHDEEI